MACKRNGSLFRSLNRRGSSPPFAPFVSVESFESFNSLKPAGRSCWQAGPFRSLPRKLRESRQSRRSACIAVKEKPAARRDSRSSVAEDMLFFTGPQKIRPVPQAARLPARRSVFRFKYRRRQPHGIQRRRGNGFLRNAGKARAPLQRATIPKNVFPLLTASPQSAPWAAAYEFHPPRRFHCGPAPPPARFPAARNAR